MQSSSWLSSNFEGLPLSGPLTGPLHSYGSFPRCKPFPAPGLQLSTVPESAFRSRCSVSGCSRPAQCSFNVLLVIIMVALHVSILEIGTWWSVSQLCGGFGRHSVMVTAAEVVKAAVSLVLCSGMAFRYSVTLQEAFFCHMTNDGLLQPAV